ncbi:unnamed protein product [Triticum turgidum subsp. durum]|uniref:EGF-like domain-containing protein n=1 Tax=Triticum turgidum subsp. durum TaxID=4567 RepID=A0A9R1A3K4_TRITD|nr:unnamed protein product [Triticum turgidum subsp. durum]
MGRTNRSALALACLLALLLVQLPRGARAVDGDLCGKVKCGMGSCGESGDYMFGFACRCNPGWSRYHLGDVDFPFLPCAIPNCTINYSCQDGSSPPAPSPPPPAAPPLTNLSVYDPCLMQYCGGGTCEKVESSAFAHRCACPDGFRNLLDDDAYPCYRQCSLGSGCSDLGIGIINGSDPSTSPPAPVSFTVQKSGAAGGSAPPVHRLLELLILISFFWLQSPDSFVN